MSLESMKVDLSGQNAIVTGASQGLGRAIAVALSASGARVALVARNAEKLAETQKLCTDAGGKADVMAGDVSSKESVEKIIDTVCDDWGQLDISSSTMLESPETTSCPRCPMSNGTT